MMRCETRKDNKNNLKLMLRYASIDSVDTEPLNRRFAMKYLPFNKRVFVQN